MVNKKAEDQGEDQGEDGGSQPPLSMQRSRWATRKLTVKSSGLKRIALGGRRHNKATADEKKRTSGGSESLRQGQRQGQENEQTDGPADNASISSEQSGVLPRTVFFNRPLPNELKDAEGHPLQQYTRNKIRTAKYTPLSFVPKNLWFQFHNVANIFFLFVVILVVSSSLPWRSAFPMVCRRVLIVNLDLSYFRRREPRTKRSSINFYIYII